MKIAIFSDVFLPNSDGVSTSLYHLVVAFRDLGHEVLVVTTNPSGSETANISGVRIVRLPSVDSVVYPGIEVGFFSPSLALDLRKFNPDIIHIATPAPVGILGLVAAKLMKIPTVAAFHTYFAEEEYLKVLGVKAGTGTLQKVLWKYSRDFYSRCDMTITPSEFVKEDLIAHGFSQPISVIKNAIKKPATVSQDKILETKKRYSLRDDVLVYVGRLSREKNLFLLIDVFKSVQKERPNAQLLLVGHGPIDTELKSYVSGQDLSDSVVFTGFIENNALLTLGLHQNAKLFVTCSSSEVQPMSIIEAMYFGLPIVAAKSRGITEMIEDNGVLHDHTDKKAFTDSIIELLDDEPRREKMSLRSREVAERYDLPQVARKHLELYKKLLPN